MILTLREGWFTDIAPAVAVLLMVSVAICLFVVSDELVAVCDSSDDC